MARIFITGSSDGLGRMAAQLLVEEGHQVVLHARNADRGRDALAAVPGAAAVLTGDMASIAQTRRLAEAANAHGPFDAVIHNAAIGFRERRRILTEDGLPLYVVAKHQATEGDDAALHAACAATTARLPQGWTSHINGNNVAYLPPGLGKAHAVACLPEDRSRHLVLAVDVELVALVQT